MAHQINSIKILVTWPRDTSTASRPFMYLTLRAKCGAAVVKRSWWSTPASAQAVTSILGKPRTSWLGVQALIQLAIALAHLLRIFKVASRFQIGLKQGLGARVYSTPSLSYESCMFLVLHTKIQASRLKCLVLLGPWSLDSLDQCSLETKRLPSWPRDRLSLSPRGNSFIRNSADKFFGT